MIQPPSVGRVLHFESSPETVRNERRWHATTEDGDPVVLAQLLPELAQEESLRRRYVYEAERLAQTKESCLAEVLAIGPSPDPKDPGAIAPWRLRREPSGVRLDRYLRDRAPLPIDEAIDLLTRLAEAVHRLHAAGLILRDLEPKHIVLGAQAQLTITDVGLARMDILSSRSASSLMLESSAYAAPEHLQSTVVDARADVYTLAAIAWQALSGVLPYDEGSPFLRDYADLPSLVKLRAGVPADVDSLLRACLSEDPNARPKSVQQLLHMLEDTGQQIPGSLKRLRCQACGTELRIGLRLCLQCGKTAVQFQAAQGEAGYSLTLHKAKEDKSFYDALVRFFEDVGEGPPPALDFLIGDVRMYSKTERVSRIKLPVALLANLSKDSALALQARLKSDGILVKVDKGAAGWKGSESKHVSIVGGAVGGSIMALGIAVSVWPVAIIGAVVGGGLIGFAEFRRRRARRFPPLGLMPLREAPAALPASDPFVARIATLLSRPLAADVHEQVSELALLVQRLCDRRVEAAHEPSAIEMLLEPLSELVTLICEEVESLRAIDAELAQLDEGNLVRAIAASEARKEDRSRRKDFFAGLDRLRDLEDRRALHMGALLQASALLERTVDLGLSETSDRLLEGNRITMALSSLGA